MSGDIKDDDIVTDDDDIDMATAADLAQSIALAEKFTHEAERAKWEAKREELAYHQEKSQFDWQTDGVYAFYKGVTPKTANQLLHAMEKWHHHNPAGKWTILMNSEGGNEYAGYSVIDQLRGYSTRGGGTHWVEIRVSGIAASMAGMVLQVADHRVMGRYSQMMIHKGNVNFGCTPLTMDELLDQADRWGRHSIDRMINVYLERTDLITRPEMLAKIRRKDWWISAEDAVNKWGFADEIR